MSSPLGALISPYGEIVYMAYSIVLLYVRSALILIPINLISVDMSHDWFSFYVTCLELVTSFGTEPFHPSFISDSFLGAGKGV